ncbi:Fasciclin-like arabinogalactan protein 14 [Linum grandiflorum]
MASTHLIILLFLAIATSSSAFNVTNVLGPLSEFSTFSNYLAQAGVVPMMADLNNVTILAVDNANMGPISGKSRAEIERIMTMHVIPEYYDLHRLNSLPNGTALIRTVYAQTRLARGKDGMLLVTKKGKMGRFNFASAILPRSKPGVNLVKSVVVLSRNISVFHVSGLIVTPPPVVSVASDADAAGRVASSGKMMVRRSFDPKTKGGMKLQVEEEQSIFNDYDLKSTEKAESKDYDEEEAPAKSPAKGKSASSPKKSPAKAPSSPKSSNSTSGGKKGKSPAPTPSSDDDSSAPAPSKKKSDGPSPATSKDAPAKSPKKAKSSAPSPSDSSEDTSAPSKSSGGGASSSPSSDSPSSASSPSDEATSNSSPPAPPSESDSADADADSPSADSPAAEAPAPSGTAAPRTVSSSVGILMMAMALWALAA